MKIEVEANDVFLRLADETYIRNRLYFGLAASHRDIVSATVSFCLIPGFESEGILQCLVEIQLTDGSSVTGDCCNSDVYVVIDRAVDRSCAQLKGSGALRWRAFSQSGLDSVDTACLSSAA